LRRRAAETAGAGWRRTRRKAVSSLADDAASAITFWGGSCAAPGQWYAAAGTFLRSARYILENALYDQRKKEQH
jgi:hypothetical protein